MSGVIQRSGHGELFAGLSDEDKRQLCRWSLEVLKFEKQQRQGGQQLSDEQLRQRLDEIVPADQLAESGLDAYRHLQQVSDQELERLIKIRELYLTSSPFASGRIQIYKDIARLAPWDETCLVKISAEYQDSGEPLKAHHWLRKALRVNPGNAAARSRLESLTSTTVLLRGRAAALRLLKISALVGAVLFLIWCTGYRVGWGEAQALAALARIQDIEIPSDVKGQYAMRHVFTRYERVRFYNPHGGSYVILATSPYRKLQHRRVIFRAGSDAQPLEAKTVRLEIRGRPAEFIYEKHAHYETVLGYFQGEQHPVHVRVYLEFSDRDSMNRAPNGGTPAFISRLEGIASPVEADAESEMRDK